MATADEYSVGFAVAVAGLAIEYGVCKAVDAPETVRHDPSWVKADVMEYAVKSKYSSLAEDVSVYPGARKQ